MPVKTAVWRIGEAGLTEASLSTLKREADLHQWIETDPKLLGDLLLIGSEVITDFGGRIDLLALDPLGTVHIIELKRDKTPREVVAQALDYASWIATLNTERYFEIFRTYKQDDLGRAYEERFGVTIPEKLTEHSITIVASSLDASSERIVEYLSRSYRVPINVLFFSVFNDDAGDILTRSWLLDPEKVEQRAEVSGINKVRGDWTGFWFVNVGVDLGENNRTWDDARKYGFISGGQGARWRDYMRKLTVGDSIFAYVKGSGYVGYGIVTQPAVMARDFKLAQGGALFDQPLKGNVYHEHPDDEELAEYVVGVDWKTAVDLQDAYRYPKIFAIQQVACKIYDPKTVAFLCEKLNVPATSEL